MTLATVLRYDRGLNQLNFSNMTVTWEYGKMQIPVGLFDKFIQTDGLLWAIGCLL